MKKKLLCLTIAACCITASYAQERNIKLPQLPKRAAYNDYKDTNTGFWCAAELSGGSTTMFKRHNMPFAGLNVINGYRINEFLRTGIGFGAKYYINNDDVHSSSIPWTFPIYLDIRGNIISQEDRTIVPYWAFDIGAEVRDGFFCSPTVGLKIGEKRSSFLLGISYSYNEIKTHKEKRESRNILSLKLGYEF